MSDPNVAGIILAAGRAARMGRTKQLLPFRGKALIEWVVDGALASGLSRVVVVLGHDRERILPLLEGREVTTVFNPEYLLGQSTSLKAGLGALGEETDAALFLLADQPFVTAGIIDRILEAYRGVRAPIVVPVHEGRRGNPVLFARETFPGILELDADCGARPLFEEYADRLLPVEVGDPGIHLDIDTAEEYAALLKL